MIIIIPIIEDCANNQNYYLRQTLAPSIEICRGKATDSNRNFAPPGG